MHSFARHGITHLSASSLNLWQTAPGLFALRYIAGIKDASNAAMTRGSAVEQGMVFLLRGKPLAEAIGAGHLFFDVNGPEKSDETAAERDLIAPMLDQCSKWKPPSALAATQLKIEHWFDPIPIPIIGYLDFAFESIDIDCKSTKACPSTPRPDHVRQVSIYRAARKKPGGIFYVTNKKHAYYDVTDEMMNEALMELHASALSLNNFLARMESKEDVLRSLPIDYDHWSAPKTKVPFADLLLAG